MAKLILVHPKTRKPRLPAGRFSSWLRGTRRALASGEGVRVPCGECRACCQSSYFIHLTPGEKGSLARIPKKLLVAAPGLPKGNLLMGHFENGFCPMLKANACSIYAHRPRTCRSYDCRLFAAAGLAAEDGVKDLVNQRVRQWRFAYPARRDRDLRTAVRAAARFIRSHQADFPTGTYPRNPTQVAVLAVKAYPFFLKKSAAHKRKRTARQTAEAIIKVSS